MDAGNPISKLISVAMILATAGVLYEVTVAIHDQAIDTQRHGMVSLGTFNRRLLQRR